MSAVINAAHSYKVRFTLYTSEKSKHCQVTLMAILYTTILCVVCLIYRQTAHLELRKNHSQIQVNINCESYWNNINGVRTASKVCKHLCLIEDVLFCRRMNVVSRLGNIIIIERNCKIYCKIRIQTFFFKWFEILPLKCPRLSRPV